ncbi:MAG: cytochrome c [Candidatus Eremiobacteraeota bacterium]|nr:cytochrome c [Candidatus Eremiobacteraeota bacterium]
MMQGVSKVLFSGLALALLVSACSSKTSTTTTTTTGSSPAATAMGAKPNSPGGAKVFSDNCASCHQATGKGLAGSFPPLAGNAVVTGDPLKVAHIIKYGLTGAVTVNGATYNGQMPAWSGTLNDGQIAAVETYIRSSWGNHASAVTTAQVTSVKQ